MLRSINILRLCPAKQLSRLCSLSIVCLAFVLTIAFANSTSAADLSLNGFDTYIEKSMKTWQVPGLAIAIVQDGSVVFSKGFGVKEQGKKDPVDQKTMFAIGSASKAFTATALAMLVDKGKIGWDSPVTDVLPNFKLADPWVSRNICLRDMLSHRTGYKSADILWIWQQNYLKRDQIVSRMRNARMAFPFRTTWHYNNLMFLAAGQVIPALTGMSWDVFIKKHIFDVLKMTSSNTSIAELKGLKNVAYPHLLEKGSIKVIPYRSVDMIAPAGAINSNIVDMTQWLKFQLNKGVWQGKALIQPMTLLQMRSPQISMPIPYPTQALPGAHFLSYGLAWFIQDYNGLKVVHHGGNIDGMTSLVALVPEKKIGFVILSNLNTSRIRDVLMYNLLDRISGKKPVDWNGHFAALDKIIKQTIENNIAIQTKSRKKNTTPSMPLAVFSGEYTNSFYGKIQIRAKDNVLFYKFQNREVPLTHWHYNTFKRPNWSIEEPGIELVTFHINSSGVVHSLFDKSMTKFYKAKKH